MLRVHDVRPAAYNPHSMTLKELSHLKRVVQRQGLVQPIVVNRRTARHGFDRVDRGLVVVGGHRRREVCIELGWTHVPCHVIEVDELAERELNAALNKIHGSFDDALLADGLQWIVAHGGDLADAGFETDETDALLASLEREDDQGEREEPATPELPAVPTTKRGQLVELGRHRLLCGDGTDPKALADLFGPQRANVVVTDPPYGVAYARGKPIAGDDQKGLVLEGFLAGAFRALAPHTTEDAAWYVWHASTNRLAFEGALRAAGVVPHQEVVWVKQSLTLGRSDYQWQHEPCLYGWGKRHRWLGDRKQTTIWKVERETKPVHPTQKPVELYRRALMNSTRKGDIVVDTFAGSGPAVLAAEMTGRTCIAVELDPAYCDVIRQRWESLRSDTTT